MGNSEVGHNAMGAGRVFAQGAKLVSEAIRSGKMFEGKTWKKAVEEAEKGGTMHFIGLFSDGNVHSHIDHLKGMVEEAKKEGVKSIRFHILLDGRDVPETSALDYVLPFEEYLKELNAQGFDYRIASGGGRMNITMDRYGANWDMVRKGWETHVAGKGRFFKSAQEAIETLRAETKAIDQDLPPFVISDDGQTPVGAIKDGDVVIYFNFRGDHAIEISEAFDDPKFDKFERVPNPKVFYAGMMEYDGDLHIPNNYLVNPPEINNTIGEYLCNSGVRQVRHQRNAEVRTRHLLLQRQPLRQVQRKARNLSGNSLRHHPVRTASVDAVRGNHRRRHRRNRIRQVRLHPPQLPERRHGRPHRQLPGGTGRHGRS